MRPAAYFCLSLIFSSPDNLAHKLSFYFKYLTGSHPSLIPRLIYRQRQYGCDCSGVLEGFHRLASCPIFKPSHPYISSSAAVIEVGMLLLFGETIAGYFSRHFRTTIRRQPHLIKKEKESKNKKDVAILACTCPLERKNENEKGEEEMKKEK